MCSSHEGWPLTFYWPLQEQLYQTEKIIYKQLTHQSLHVFCILVYFLFSIPWRAKHLPLSVLHNTVARQISNKNKWTIANHFRSQTLSVCSNHLCACFMFTDQGTMLQLILRFIYISVKTESQFWGLSIMW